MSSSTFIKELWLDFETYSEVPIKHGTYKYNEHSEPLLLAWAIDDEPAVVYDFTEPGNELFTPEGFNRAARVAREVWAHNAMFDRTHGDFSLQIFQEIPLERWRDTMVQAFEHGLPGSLGKLGEVLGLPEDEQKSKDGRQLVHLFCKPRPKNMKLRRATRDTHPEEWERFKDYARQDVETMRRIQRMLPNINYPKGPELAHWHLDQRINDRGFLVDLELVEGALGAVKDEKEALRLLTVEMTEGELTSTTRRDKMLQYILEYHGVVLPDLTKGNVERLVRDPDLPRPVRELLAVRLQATASSTAKYTALKNAVNSDGRCRGTIQFAGAKRTARAAGRVFQPQNLPSRGLLPSNEIAFGTEALKVPGLAREVFPNTMKLLASCIRGVVIAPKGRKLVIADLSNIEGRLAAWFAGETWKLDAFREYDTVQLATGTWITTDEYRNLILAGRAPELAVDKKGELIHKGDDLYNLAYSRAFRTDVKTVTKQQRSIGKVLELFLGYEGGVGAFVTGALGYGFDMEQLAKDIWHTLPTDKIQEATKYHAWVQKKNLQTFGLSLEAFVTADVLKRLWRETNSHIAAIWKTLESAAVQAVKNPGEIFEAGDHAKFQRRKNYLLLRLPSGRSLVYPSPRVDLDGKLSFLGENNFTKKWQRIGTHGGKILENLCQATGREVLYSAMPEAEKRGYAVVLHVHDELVCEVDDTAQFNVEELAAIMSRPLDWTQGLPLSAAGFETYRYRKD